MEDRRSRPPSAEETYPVIETGPVPLLSPRAPGEPAAAPSRWSALGRLFVWEASLGLCLLHGLAIWAGLGGREGVDNGWPIWRHDHPLYFHSASITRSFLPETGTTAGYDPSFMSGYAKSVVFPSSSTLPELVLCWFGGDRPERAYKLYVLAAAALVPWLVLLAAAWTRAGAGGSLLAVGLTLTYFWTDYPAQYAMFGMLPYLLAIPLGLIATAAIAGYAGRGGLLRWLLASTAASLCVLVHLTAAMIVVPAAAACYLVGIVREGKSGRAFSASRHVGIWLIPAVVLASNAFWWYPGPFLASTKGRSDFAFTHREPEEGRLLKIPVSEPPIQGVLIGLGVLGMAATIARAPIAGSGLLAFGAAGFFWGYLAGWFRGLDFLQPGRHTYAFYLAMALAAGVGWSEVCRRLQVARTGLDFWATLGLLLAGVSLFGSMIDRSVSSRLGRAEPLSNRLDPGYGRRTQYVPMPEPFLSSRPSARLTWVIDRVKEHVRPGERLYYEEGGFGIPGEPDPFDDGRFSGLLPGRCGVEVIGGPYLHASLATNFTQFGEGKLFGVEKWGRDDFVRYAKLYRPAAIVCWTRRARAFCKDNPDLVDIKDDDGRVLIGRVKGFEGSTIRGEAAVEAGPNRLVIRDVRPGLDGLTVLRYHSAPCLRSRPEGRWEPVVVEGDPVPFIGVRPSAEPIELELVVPPPWRRRSP